MVSPLPCFLHVVIFYRESFTENFLPLVPGVFIWGGGQTIITLPPQKLQGSSVQSVFKAHTFQIPACQQNKLYFQHKVTHLILPYVIVSRHSMYGAMNPRILRHTCRFTHLIFSVCTYGGSHIITTRFHNFQNVRSGNLWLHK